MASKTTGKVFSVDDIVFSGDDEETQKQKETQK